MASKTSKVVVSVDAETSGLTSGLKGVDGALQKTKTNVKDLNKTLETDTVSAGKTVARALEQTAQDIKDDLAKAERAAEALGNALGPEMRAKLGDSGVDNLIGDIKKLGLTYEDVETDAEELARAVKSIDDVGGPAVKDARTGIKGVGEEFDDVKDKSEKAKGATHGMLGGIAGDSLGAMAGIGPLGEGVSQLTEGALSGEAAFGSLLGAGLAMGAVTVVVKGIMDHFEKLNKIKAFNKKQVDEFTTALLSADGVAKTLVGTLTAAGKIEFTNSSGDTKDATAALAAYNMTAAEFATLVQGGKSAIDQWRATTIAANPVLQEWAELHSRESTLIGIEAQRHAVLDHSQAVKDLDDTYNAAIQQSQNWTKAEENAADHSKVFTTSLDQLSKAAANMGQRSRDARGDVDHLAGAVDDADTAVSALDQTYQRLTGHLDERASWRNAEEAIWALNSAADPTATDVDNLARAVGDYVYNSNQISESKKTQFLADIDKAQGDAVALNKIYDDVAKARTVVFNPDARKVKGPYAKGTDSATPGVHLVGEEGPELVEFSGGEKVHTAAETAQMRKGSTGRASGGNTTIINNFPPGTRPDDVARSTARFTRRNGRAF